MKTSEQQIILTSFSFERKELEELADEIRNAPLLREQLHRAPALRAFCDAVMGWAPSA